VSPTLISFWRRGTRVPAEAELARLRRLAERTKPHISIAPKDA
jgi:hypothetical protein